MKLKISIIIAVFALAAAACLKNEIVKDINLDKMDLRSLVVSAPIAKVHIPLAATMEKHLDFKELFVDKDGIVCIKYVQSDGIKWDEDIDLRSYSNNWTIPVSGGVMTGGTKFKVHLVSTDEADSDVKEAYLTAGKISFTLSVSGGLSGNIIVTIPELTKDGVAFSQTIPLSSSGAPNVFSLKGYKIATDNNRDLNVQFAGTISGSGSLNVAFALSEMEESYLSGYFGKMTRNENIKMDIDFFDELDFKGVIGIKDIKMDAVITSRVGLPMSVKADIFFTNEAGLDKQLELTPPLDFSVNGASNASAPVKKSFSTTLPVIEFGGEAGYPAKVKIEVEGIGNPNGNPAGNVENFIGKSAVDSLVKVDFTLTVPLHIKIGEYSRNDTIGFDYNDIMGNSESNINVNNVEYLYVNIVVDNGLPFDIGLGATAINEQGTYKSPILPVTSILADDRGKRIEIKLEKNQLEEFRTKEVKKIILQTTGKTKNAEYVKVKDTAFLDISVSVGEAKLNIPSKF